MGSNNPEILIDSIRNQFLAKGLSGIKGLAVFFRRIDKDYSKTVSFNEFHDGMRRYRITLTDEELKTVFNYLDVDRSGEVDFREVLVKLRPPMPQCRVDLVNEVFDKLDCIKDGILQVDDLKIVYKDNAMKHPKYISKEWNLEQVLQSFLDTFDSEQDKDGAVTREEFMQYFAGVSSTIDDDAYFDLMMRSCWGLPPRGYVMVK